MDDFPYPVAEECCECGSKNVTYDKGTNFCQDCDKVFWGDEVKKKKSI